MQVYLQFCPLGLHVEVSPIHYNRKSMEVFRATGKIVKIMHNAMRTWSYTFIILCL